MIALAERAPGALLVATPSSEGGHPAGVPVLTPDADDRATLAALCPPKTHLVDYGPYLSPPARRRGADFARGAGHDTGGLAATAVA